VPRVKALNGTVRLPDMSDHDTRELLILCETILEDGELTYDELYKLAMQLRNSGRGHVDTFWGCAYKCRVPNYRYCSLNIRDAQSARFYVIPIPAHPVQNDRVDDMLVVERHVSGTTPSVKNRRRSLSNPLTKMDVYGCISKSNHSIL
jgi:hypothetical protein